jgi:hypothetical protein
VAFTNVLTVLSNIPYLKSTIPPFSFFAHSPIPGKVSIDIIFPFTYMCTQYLHCVHPPMNFLPSPPLVPTPSGRTCYALLYSNFV